MPAPANSMISYLPLLWVPLQHHRVFRLGNFPVIFILDLLDIFGGLNALIFGKCSLVSLAAGVGEEVWADWFDFAVYRLG